MIDLPASAGACARYRVVHETRYKYQSAVTLSQQYLHMTPRSFPYQQTESHQIWLDPVVNDGNDGIDYFGNSTRHVAITVPHNSLLVHAESTVVLSARHSLAQIEGTLPWESVRDMMAKEKSAATLEACRYLYASPHVTCFPELEAYARISYTPGRPQLDAALELTHRIFDDFEFDGKATDISTPLEEVLRGRRGVCQDFAHLAVAALRSVGLAARYVSGYLETQPPPGKPRLVGADASHAWASVFAPGVGWVDLDPTNYKFVDDSYIVTAIGRDYSDVPPLKGVIYTESKKNTLKVSVDMAPIVGDSVT